VTTQISPRVHRLGTQLVNFYVVEDGGRLTVIDAGLPKYAADLEARLGAIGHKLEDVDAVVLTHSDSDHTGSVPVLREAGAKVLIHRDDEETLRKPGPKTGDASPKNAIRAMWRPRFWRTMGAMTRGGGAKPPKIEGAETFADGDVLEVPGRPRVIHTPGHTPGHSALHFEDHRALFVGDALYTRNLLTGRPGPEIGPKIFNVDTEAARRSLAAIESIDADVLLPGHGDPWRDGASAAVARARA
jgi:glyoxylase-like metal-dependent hydrolase (beta-lactamase superfamily II)